MRYSLESGTVRSCAIRRHSLGLFILISEGVFVRVAVMMFFLCSFYGVKKQVIMYNFSGKLYFQKL
jgi:hypothetical protein